MLISRDWSVQIRTLFSFLKLASDFAAICAAHNNFGIRFAILQVRKSNVVKEATMKQLGELLVADYMADQAVVVDDSMRLVEAIQLMKSVGVSVLPVVDGQSKLVGILSTTDLLELTHEIQADLTALSHVSVNTQDFLIQMLIEQGDTTYVRDMMTSPVDSVTPNLNLVVAARKLVDHKYHHLPVVDESEKPIGVLSSSDFVRAVAEHGALLAG